MMKTVFSDIGCKLRYLGLHVFSVNCSQTVVLFSVQLVVDVCMHILANDLLLSSSLDFIAK